jgi:hypothetical protein
MDDKTALSLMTKVVVALGDNLSASETFDDDIVSSTIYAEMDDEAREEHLRGFESDLIKYRQEYENCYDCRVIQIPRRKEDTGWLSFMSYSTKSLVDEDSHNFITDLREIEEDNVNRQIPLNLHIYIDTVGGRLSTAEVICKAMLQYPGHIRVYVSNKAMSTGTMIALSAHEIHLRRYAHLGQIDPQIGNYWFWLPANSIENTTNKLDEYETPLFRDLMRSSVGPAKSANSRVMDLINRIAETRKWSATFKDAIYSNMLYNISSGGYGHDMPIDYNDLQKFWPQSSTDKDSTDKDSTDKDSTDENYTDKEEDDFSNPFIYPDWPRSAKILVREPETKTKTNTKIKTETPNKSIFSAFGF